MNITTTEEHQLRKAVQTLMTLDSSSQDRLIARMIAGSVHSGKSSALFRFADKDVLDVDRVIMELSELRTPMEREAWADALGRFIWFAGEPS